jgi:tRNA 2-thiouridine synthesizing protein A
VSDSFLDCKGLSCPAPLMRMSRAMKELDSGETLEVVADDPAFLADVHAWVAKTGHGLAEQGEQNDIQRVVLRKC